MALRSERNSVVELPVAEGAGRVSIVRGNGGEAEVLQLQRLEAEHVVHDEVARPERRLGTG
jgi:hypothetical protein